jgi:hypothetical protein
MPTPEDAFGIYSLHAFRCLRADTLGCLDCLSPYQLQAVSGNCYASVVFLSDSREAKASVDELLGKYLPMGQAPGLQIPDLPEATLPYSGNLKYIRGPISASHVSFSLAQIVEGTFYEGIWFVPPQSPEGSYTAYISKPDRASREKIKTRISPKDIRREGEDFLCITGTDGKSGDEPDDFGF